MVEQWLQLGGQGDDSEKQQNIVHITKFDQKRFADR